MLGWFFHGSHVLYLTMGGCTIDLVIFTKRPRVCHHKDKITISLLAMQIEDMVYYSVCAYACIIHRHSKSKSMVLCQKPRV